MKKIILTTIIPLLIFFPIAIFIGIKQYTIEVPNGQTIFTAKIGILQQYWYLVLIAVISVIYMKFIAPKIFKD